MNTHTHKIDSRNNRCSKAINSFRWLDFSIIVCTYSLHFALGARTVRNKTKKRRDQNHAKKGEHISWPGRSRWWFAVIFAPFKFYCRKFSVAFHWCSVRRMRDLCAVTNLSNVDSSNNNSNKNNTHTQTNTHKNRKKKRHNGIWLELR